MKRAIGIIIAGAALGVMAVVIDPFVAAESDDPTRACVNDSGTWHCYLPADLPPHAEPVYYGPSSGIQAAFADR